MIASVVMKCTSTELSYSIVLRDNVVSSIQPKHFTEEYREIIGFAERHHEHEIAPYRITDLFEM